MSQPNSPSASYSTPCATAADDAAWFASEVHRHDSQLKSYLRGSFPEMRDVDDVVQESYLRVWRARAGQPIRSVRAFLFTVARRLALDALRHRRGAPVVSVPDLTAVPVIAEGATAAEAACTGEEIALLAEALEALPPRCREIIILRKFQHRPQKDVSRMLGISEATVQEQVYRGLRRMERILFRRGVIRPWQHE
jgi:RNA polymerase sigma-70 factor (ECF subfamily)